eukprot:scaffold3028_cov174-Amphora_coffeaeformis.AAC.26
MTTISGGQDRLPPPVSGTYLLLGNHGGNLRWYGNIGVVVLTRLLVGKSVSHEVLPRLSVSFGRLRGRVKSIVAVDAEDASGTRLSREQIVSCVRL